MEPIVTAALFQELVLKTSWLIPVITAFVQAFKVSGFPTRLLPILAMVIGALGGWLFIIHGQLGVLIGLCFGLASVGLFETLKTSLAGR